MSCYRLLYCALYYTIIVHIYLGIFIFSIVLYLTNSSSFSFSFSYHTHICFVLIPTSSLSFSLLRTILTYTIHYTIMNIHTQIAITVVNSPTNKVYLNADALLLNGLADSVKDEGLAKRK